MRSLTLVFLLILCARAVPAQTVAIRENAPGLLAKARISGDSALKVALARVPNSTMKSAEIEKEHGKLVYSFDLTMAGKPGITEVQVDAVTGKVVAVEHESVEDEAKESGKEKPMNPDPNKP